MRELIIRAIHVSLYPALAPSKRYSRPAMIFVVLMFLLAGALAFPPLKDWLFCKLGLFALSREDRETGKNWCDFAIVGCQIVLVMVVGGIVVTDALTKWLVEFGAYIREEIEGLVDPTAMHGPPTERQQRLEQYLTQLKQLEAEIRVCGFLRLPGMINRASGTVSAIYDLFDTHGYVRIVTRSFAVMPNTWVAAALVPFAWAIQMRLAAAFPGGLQGLFGFAFFWLMIMASTVKTFLDYPASCVVSV